MNNYDKLTKEVADGLKNKSSILIQSNHGDDNNDLVIDAIQKAGLKLVSIELAGPAKIVTGQWTKAPDKDSIANETDEQLQAKREKMIRTNLKNEKGNALLVEMHPESPATDINAFIKVAEELKIPLIVSKVNGAELNASIFESKDMLFSAVKGEDPKDEILARMKRIQNLTAENTSEKRLRM